jgi:carboxymethylenebutenolidase
VREEAATIQAPDEALPGFWVMPDGWPPGPAVVVVHEWWGLDDHIQDIAGRLAAAGFAALAPDLYRGKRTEEPDEAQKLAMELDRPQALNDLRAAVAWLAESGATGLGATGFCMGGSLVFELACEEPRLDAAAPFYGLADIRGRTIRARVAAHFGTADRYEPELLEDVRSRLKGQHRDNELYLYEGAPHAFMKDTRPSYRGEAATLAWDRTVALFRERLR